MGRYGIGCRTYQEPAVVGPPSYLVTDIGKPGVPELEPVDLATLHRVVHYYGASRTMRFAYLAGRRFVLFDPKDDPCADNDIRIINSRNEFYEPGEAPGFTGAVPGESMGTTPPPWMTPTPKPR